MAYWAEVEVGGKFRPLSFPPFPDRAAAEDYITRNRTKGYRYRVRPAPGGVKEWLGIRDDS